MSLHFSDNLIDNVHSGYMQQINDYSNMAGGGDYSENNDISVNQIDSELKRLLMDEKDRNEQLKRYYEALKGDYARSQGEVLDLQTQLKNLIEENKIMQDKYKSMLEKMQQELKKKQLYVEELKIKELDEVKLEKLKEELGQQIEVPYKDIVKQLEQELERLHEDCNKLRYENSYLKSTGEHEKTEFQALTQQFKLKHDIELNAIRKDRDVLRQKLQEINYTEASKIREILKENNQFKIKIKSLLEENDELRSKYERNESHQSSLMRNHSKSTTDHMAKISLLDSEKDSVKLQNDSLHKEIMHLNETIANQTRKIHDLERENLVLKSYVDEMKHNHKKELANMKLDIVKEKGEHNRTKEMFLNQMEDLKTKLEICESNLEIQKKLVDEKEREISRSVNAVHEENWTKISELTNEKLDAESRLQILQKDLEYKTNVMQSEKDKNDEKLRLMEKQRDELYRENTRLRTLVNENENIRAVLEREQEKHHELNKKLHKLETELATNNSLEHELTEINLKLKNDLTFYIQESQKTKEHLQRMKEEFESRLGDMKAQYVGEKSEYQLKMDELQSRLRRTTSELAETKTYHEKKKSQYQRYTKQIKAKHELLQARTNELKIREQALKNSVPLEIHNRVKQKLQDILKRHQDYRNMLFMNQPPPQNVLNYGNNPIASSEYFTKTSHFVETEMSPKLMKESLMPNKHEIDQLTSRLDELTQKQNEHLKEIIDSNTLKSKSLNNSMGSLYEKQKSAKQMLSTSSSSTSSSSSDSDSTEPKRDHGKTQTAILTSTPPSNTPQGGLKQQNENKLSTIRIDEEVSSEESYEEDFETSKSITNKI